jgi:hypothetical protein
VAVTTGVDRGIARVEWTGGLDRGRPGSDPGGGTPGDIYEVYTPGDPGPRVDEKEVSKW